jgi:hypothetical protein
MAPKSRRPEEQQHCNRYCWQVLLSVYILLFLGITFNNRHSILVVKREFVSEVHSHLPPADDAQKYFPCPQVSTVGDCVCTGLLCINKV